MATTDNLFQTIYDGYNGTFSSGENSSISTALSTVSTYTQGCLGLYVLISGLLVMTGALSFDAGIKRCIRALLIAALLTPATYNQWVTTIFTQTVPNAISSATGETPNASGAQVFDQLLNSDEAMVAQVLATAGSSIFSIGKVISAYIAMGLAEIALMLAFLIWFMAYALIYVAVSLGPYVLLFWLFDATRAIPERLFGKLIGYMVLMVMVLTLTEVVQIQEKAYVTAYASMMTTPTTAGVTAQPGYVTPEGMWVDTSSGGTTTQTASGGNLDEQVSILWKMAMAFGFGSALMLLLPAIAAYVGGGVAVQISPILNTASRVIGLR